MSDHPDKLRYGSDALQERSDRMRKLAVNIVRERRLWERLYHNRQASDHFEEADVEECEDVFKRWQAEMQRVISGEIDPDDLPDPPQTTNG